MIRAFLLVFTLAVSLDVCAQQPGPPNSANQVSLSVVVEDKTGKPVTGLQQQDFTLLSNKQPQTILAFRAVNQSAAASDTEIILVLDAVNTDFSRVAYAREQMDGFLRRDAGRLTFPVSIGIFSDSGLELVPGASRDGNALAAVLDQRQTGLRSSGRWQGVYGAEDRANFSVRAIQQLAAYEQNRPGRKLVIWVSPGWALLTGPRIQLTSGQQKQIFDTFVAITSALQQAGITLYNVNPVGAAESLTSTFYYESFLNPIKKLDQVQLAHLSLQVLAVHSGGLVLNSSNDIGGEIARAARDAGAYYVLTFEPPPADGPNFYNAITVKLSRSGLKARTISGFYSQPSR